MDKGLHRIVLYPAPSGAVIITCYPTIEGFDFLNLGSRGGILGSQVRPGR